MADSRSSVITPKISMSIIQAAKRAMNGVCGLKEGDVPASWRLLTQTESYSIWIDKVGEVYIGVPMLYRLNLRKSEHGQSPEFTTRLERVPYDAMPVDSGDAPEPE